MHKNPLSYYGDNWSAATLLRNQELNQHPTTHYLQMYNNMKLYCGEGFTTNFLISQECYIVSPIN